MALDREAESSELATLVAGMAHEINNPITYVLGNLRELTGSCAALAETLAGYRRELRLLAGPSAPARIDDVEAKLREAGGLELVDELVSDASDGAARIRDLMRDLLSVSRSVRAMRAPVQLETVLEQTLRLVARPLAARAELERDFAATRPIQGDAAQLGQVFLNLLTNALDACAAAPERDAHRICVRTRDVAGRAAVRIEVDDSGAGIHPDEGERVFAPFFTTKPTGSGTGLGLYLSLRIVREHGGEIGFEPLAPGTRFWLELPAGTAQADQKS